MRLVMMKKNKKVSLGKKPFLVLSRRAIAGWVCVIFLVCAWMFAIGVLVGRGTAPVKFDIAKLETKLKASGEDLKKQGEQRAQAESEIAEDKTNFDFYEALKENPDDNKIDRLTPPKVVAKKIQPSREPAPSDPGESAPEPPDPSVKTNGKTGLAPAEAAKEPSASKVDSEEKIPTEGKAYTIQVASVKDMQDADRLVADLKKKGFPAYRVIAMIPGKGVWFRVRVGAYPSREAGGSTLEKLKKAGKKPIVVEK